MRASRWSAGSCKDDETRMMRRRRSSNTDVQGLTLYDVAGLFIAVGVVVLACVVTTVSLFVARGHPPLSHDQASSSSCARHSPPPKWPELCWVRR